MTEESGVSNTTFRQALSHFASGVTVVTVETAEGPVGFTATGFTSVSLVPPLVLVCIDEDASAHDAVVAGEHFGISILSVDQSWVALQFARSNIDRFHGVPLREPPKGGRWRAPFIEGALVHLECRKHARYVEGDHTILIGRVLLADVHPGRPLLHCSRQFGSFEKLV
jgi:flavin reductase (DIM6/NTAB) family NADH-FMN oxidoreductase RutF